MQAQDCKMERDGPGRYQVRDPYGLRLGSIQGCAGHWRAEEPDGKPLTCYNTRADAIAGLRNAARFRAR